MSDKTLEEENALLRKRVSLMKLFISEFEKLEEENHQLRQTLSKDIHEELARKAHIAARREAEMWKQSAKTWELSAATVKAWDSRNKDAFVTAMSALREHVSKSPRQPEYPAKVDDDAT
jgi:tRNA(His) 5'-end guanylyltransferase